MTFIANNDRASAIPDIRLVGVGGAGIGILSQIYSTTKDASFIAIDSSKDCVESVQWSSKVILGGDTQKLGCGGNPEKGRQLALRSVNEIRFSLLGADMIVLAAGLGGGVGSGAISVIACIAKEICDVVICFTIMPFPFEGMKRYQVAKDTLQDIEVEGAAIAVLSNKKILDNFSPETPLVEIMNEMGYQLSSMISKFLNIIMTSSMINIDFSDMKAVLSAGGHLFIGNPNQNAGVLSEEVVEQAMANRVLESFDVTQSDRAILMIEAGNEFNLGYLHEIGGYIESMSKKDLQLIMGVNITPRLANAVKVTVLLMTAFVPDTSGSKIRTIGRYYE